MNHTETCGNYNKNCGTCQQCVGDFVFFSHCADFKHKNKIELEEKMRINIDGNEFAINKFGDASWVSIRRGNFKSIIQGEVKNIATIRSITTHYAPDLDACLSVWIVQQAIRDLDSSQGDTYEIPVCFNFTGMKQEECDPHSMYVDMACGYKGSETECASVWLGKRLLSEIEYQALDLLGVWEYVQAVDTGNQIAKNPIGTNLIASWKLYGLSDLHIIERSDELFTGLLILGLKKLQAQQLKKTARFYQDNGGRVAVIEQPEGEQLNPVEFDEDEHVIAVVTKIGKNLGAKRLIEDIDLRRLQLDDEWFTHPSGFMVQWGSLSEKGKKAEIEPPISADNLAARIASLDI